MGTRELVGSAILSNHLETKPHESAVDRVGALGCSTDLGRAMWRWAYADDARAVKSALHHLLRKARSRTKVYEAHTEHKTLERACLMVLLEWRHPHCRVCSGAGQVGADDHQGAKAMYVCHTCSGSGKHRYSDLERAQSLKLDAEDYRKGWERRVYQIWAILSTADLSVGPTVREQLER